MKEARKGSKTILNVWPNPGLTSVLLCSFEGTLG